AGARAGAGAVPGAAGDLRRRAGLGALLPDRVRARSLGRGLGVRPRARARRRRLQGDRLAAAREGLSRLGRRHHARGHALRGRAWVRGQARQGRLPRPGRAARAAGARAPAALPRARRPSLDRARVGACARGRRARRARYGRRLRPPRREAEHVASLRAAELGVGPEVVAFLEPEGYLVTRFVEGEVGRVSLEEAAELLRRFHGGRPIAGHFDCFRVVEAYAETAREYGLA